MQIKFEDGGYIEIQRSNPKHLFIIVAAKNVDNPNETIHNSVELTEDQFLELVQGFLPQKKRKDNAS